MQKSQDLTTGSLPIQIKQIAIPASIGFFFHTMYNVVDSIFAGKLSTEALAALGLSFPIFFLILAFSNGFGRAAGAIIGNNLGTGKQNSVTNETQQTFGFGFLITGILMLIGLLGTQYLLEMMRIEGQTLVLALEYTHMIYYGTIGFILFSFSNAILTAHGDSKPFRNMLILGFFLNLILNPILIYGWLGFPKLGFTGIALSTVIIEFITGIYLLMLCVKRGYLGLLKISHLVPRFNFIKEMLVQGIPASMNMLMISIGFFVTNYFVTGFGAEAIAMFGVATKIEQIILLPSIGLSIAVSTIVAQNNGAGKFDRIMQTLKIGSKWGWYIILPLSLLMAVFGEWLMRIFTNDAVVINLGVKFLWVMFWTEWSYVIGGIHLSALQGMKKPMLGFISPLFRTVIGRILLFNLCVNLMGLGLESIWWSIVGLNTVMTCFVIWYTRRLIGKKLE